MNIIYLFFLILNFLFAYTVLSFVEFVRNKACLMHTSESSTNLRVSCRVQRTISFQSSLTGKGLKKTGFYAVKNQNEARSTRNRGE